MHRSFIPRGTAPVLAVFSTALLIGLVAFEMGAATAGAGSRRRTTTVVEAVQHAAPAVVSVFADSRTRRGYLRRGAGSGVIVHPSGYVVTNSHVIKGGHTLKVQLFKGRETYPARVVVNDPGRDLALLKIEGAPGSLRHVSIAPTSRVLLGESAIAVGNPRGLGDTITVGVVSALGRDAKIAGGAELRNLIQTDASINTGNSGGALLNLDGELIGVIVSLLPSASGIAFAIPGDQVQQMLRRALRTSAPSNALRDTPAVTAARPPQATSSQRSNPAPSRGGLPAPTVRGGTPGPATPTPGPAPVTRKPSTTPLHPTDFGLDVYDTGREMRVRHVTRASEAEGAGFRAGDVILTVDGAPVEDRTDLLLSFSKSRVGQEYYVGVRRGTVRRFFVLSVPK